MSTKLTTPIKRDTGIVLGDDRTDRKLEVILRLNAQGKPEIAFHLQGLKSDCAIGVLDAYALAASSPEEFAPLERPVKFRSSASYKNGSKMTPLNVTVYPDDTVTIRQNGSAASTNLGSVWTRCLMTEAKIEMPKARRKP
jgi:hypothetical protein